MTLINPTGNAIQIYEEGQYSLGIKNDTGTKYLIKSGPNESGNTIESGNFTVED